MQINVMSARVAALVAQAKDRWQLAGDQLYLDMDLSAANLPGGNAARDWSGSYRSHLAATYRLLQIRLALRPRRDEVCKLRGRART